MAWGFVKKNIVVNGITSKMMESCERVYQRTYRNAIKKVQEILYQQVGSVYEVFMLMVLIQDFYNKQLCRDTVGGIYRMC